MPPLKDVTTMITAARSRAMRFTLIIQNFAQLNEVYGEQNAETIKGNCGNMVYLISTELKALEEISKMCGEKKSKKDDKTVSTPLITISDLQKLKQFEVIIRRIRLAPFKTKLTPNFKIDWGKQYPSVNINDVPSREIREIKTFNVKTYVDEKIKNNKDNLLDFTNDRALPFNPFMGGSPFGGGLPFESPVPSKKKNDDSFDIDAVVKQIDAKIAELEKEEQEKNNKIEGLVEKNKEINLDSIINNKEVRKENNDNLEKIINSNIKEMEDKDIDVKPPSNSADVETNKKVLDIDDDEFFDDFFD